MNEELTIDPKELQSYIDLNKVERYLGSWGLLYLTGIIAAIICDKDSYIPIVLLVACLATIIQFIYTKLRLTTITKKLIDEIIKIDYKEGKIKSEDELRIITELCKYENIIQYVQIQFTSLMIYPVIMILFKIESHNYQSLILFGIAIIINLLISIFILKRMKQLNKQLKEIRNGKDVSSVIVGRNDGKTL